MNLSILEKYDNLILRNIKADKLKYILLMLPYKLPLVLILGILVATRLVSPAFLVAILGGFAILKFTTKGKNKKVKKIN